MSAIRVGVIGVGHLGTHHARIYTEILGAQLVGVADINEDRASAVGGTMGTPSFDDYRRFLDRAKPDAVSVVVPTSLHYEISKEAMERGIHVLIEKPVTTRVEQAEELLRLAEVNHLVLQVGHVERFNSAVQHIREMATDPMLIQCRRMGPFSPRISDVGVVLDLMIHDIDIVMSLITSDIEQIAAVGRSVCSDHEDMASAQLCFKNGAIAHILVSRVAEKRMRTMEISERERYITVNFETQDVTINRCIRHEGGGLVEILERPVFPKKEPLKLELQHFVSCVREGRQPLVGIKDGKRALEVCIAVLRQIDTLKLETATA